MIDPSTSYFLFSLLILIIGLPLGLMIFLRYWQGRDNLADINSLICLTVSLPKQTQPKASGERLKELEELIAPMEQFYSSLTTIIHQRHFIDWLFSTPAHISFEIVSTEGVIRFQIVAPKRLRSIIERQLQSFFPEAETQVGAPVSIFQAQKAITGVVFEQAKNFILPIKTYRELDVDPLSSLTNVLTKLTSGTAAIQLLIRPIGENWRVHTHMASSHVRENRLHLVNTSGWRRFISSAVHSKTPTTPAGQLANNQSTLKPLTPQQEVLMTALQQKGSKTGFEAIMRVVTTGESEEQAEENLRSILAAFAQFHSPELNSLRYRKVVGHRIAREYLFRLFNQAPKMILNVEELSSLVHLPNRLLETPGVKWTSSRSLPAPANLPKEGIVIGESDFRGVKQLIRLKEEDRRRHLFMIGKTGVGKTTLFETMIEQDMHNGHGLCFIDPLGDAVESLLKKVPTNRAKDVVLFDPSDTQYPLGVNLLEFTRPEEKDFLIQEVIEIFYKLFDPHRTGIVGPQWEHWARNAALTVMSQPGGGTLIDLPRLFTDDAFRTQAIQNVTDPVVRSFWDKQLAKTSDFHKSEMYNYFISKFGRFMTNDLMRNIIGQSQSSFNFRELMDSGKILLVNLAKGKIGEINSDLLGLIIVAKLQVAAFSRADQPEDQRRDFFLYVDEFQNFATDTFETILAEARKYRLNLNITNQYFAQLPENLRQAVIGNVGSLISYRVGADDAQILTHELPGVTSEDLTNLDRFQAYAKLLVDLAPTKPFSLRGLKSPNQGSEEMTTWIKTATRSHYAKPPVQLMVPAGIN